MHGGGVELGGRVGYAAGLCLLVLCPCVYESFVIPSAWKMRYDSVLSSPTVRPNCIIKVGCCVLLFIVVIVCRVKIPWVPSAFVRVRPKPADPGFYSVSV